MKLHNEAERERLNNRWRSILESTTGEGIGGVDMSGRIIFINRAGASLHGYTPEEMVGRDTHYLVHHSRADGSPQRCEEFPLYSSFLNGQAGRIEGEVLWRRDGTNFPAEIAVYPLINDGIVEGSVINFSDISERLRVQEELRQAKEAAEAAEAANRAKSEFLVNMSHELRTPLNSVLGYAQLLRGQPGLSDSQNRALAVIQHSGEHLLGLIDDILDTAKIEAGTLELRAADFDLDRLLEGIAAIMRRRAEASGLTFMSARWSEIPALVSGDEHRLRQVLVNLLDNAIKYTREGGVALKVGLQEERICFLVEDTGIGIKPEHLTEIFAVFHQVRDPRAAVEGTGLGLAISKQLVRLMGGELQVASSPGEGSRFWFSLELPPASVPVSTWLPEERVVVGVEGDRRRVLVVDDEENGRNLLRDLLAPLGFEVHEARDGSEGVCAALSLKPNAILMDMRMPGLDGLQATRQIRASADLKDTVIIAVSASAFEHNRAHCLEAGADDFLPKPFRQGKLLGLLSQHLGLKLRYLGEDDLSPSPSHLPPPELIVPSAEQLQVLLDLARRGDIKNLLRQANRLEELDEDYSSFAGRLRTLAEAYEIKKLRHWLTSLDGAP